MPNGLLVEYTIAAEALAETDSEREGNHFAAAFDLPALTYEAATCIVAPAAPKAPPVVLPREMSAEPRLIEREDTTSLALERNGLHLAFQRSPKGKSILQDARHWHRPYYQALLYARRSPADPPGWRSVALLIQLGKSAAGPRLVSLRPGASPLPCNDVHEARFACWASADNPFVPGQIRAWADVQTPSGRHYPAAAFLYRRYERTREGDAEVLTPTGLAEWRLRIAPTEPGPHQYTVRVKTPHGTAASGKQSFIATPSKGRGFVRAPARQKRYLESSDGRPLFLLGYNYAWPHTKAGTYAIEQAIDQMAAAQINATRLWLCSWGIGIESERPDHYRLADAWRLDHILAHARRRGVGVQLCLDNFTDLTAEKHAARNPYLARNGGPCRQPAEFFSSPKAMAQHQRRLRYLIGRYAAYTSLLAWELGSELDYATANRRDPALLHWVQGTAQYVAQNDPHAHPITVSLGLGASWEELWKTPQLHMVQPHLYVHRPVYVPSKAQLDAAALIGSQREKFAAIQKPLLIGEFGFMGSRDANPLNEADKTGIHLHNSLWAAALSGCAGTPLHWWWDSYVHANRLHHHYTALARFLHGEPLPGQGWSFLEDATKSPVRVLGYRTATRALLWVQHRDNGWYRRLVDQKGPTPLQAIVVGLPDMADGRYRVEWWDTYAGQPITHALTTTDGGHLTLRVPAGQPDIACKLRRVTD
ncbi:hypothetical protein HQ576_10330 [bacterium]|nr:hypothetical protein [bacterium]